MSRVTLKDAGGGLHVLSLKAAKGSGLLRRVLGCSHAGLRRVCGAVDADADMDEALPLPVDGIALTNAVQFLHLQASCTPGAPPLRRIQRVRRE